MRHARIAATPMPNGCQAAVTTASIAVQHAATTASVARRNIGLTRAMTTQRRAGSTSTATAAAGLCPDDGSRPKWHCRRSRGNWWRWARPWRRLLVLIGDGLARLHLGW